MQTSHDPGPARGPLSVCACWLRGGLLVVVAVLVLAPSAALGQRKPSTTSSEQLAFGVKMAQRGLWSEALFRFKQADRLSPEDPRVLNNLAVAHEALGMFDQALEIYREALRIDPNNQALRRNYARFVEFYQSFKPPEEGIEGAPGDAGETPAAAEPPAATEEPTEGEPDGERSAPE